jgi:hypothetical protein
MMSNTWVNKRSLVVSQTLAATAAVVAAVALPQLFHVLGLISGAGPAVGATLLPMQLPVLLAGFLAGPLAGLAAGVLSPLVSFALSGMPAAILLPFLMLELAAYGLAAGYLRRAHLPRIGQLLIVQIVGRAVRAAAILFAVYALGSALAPAAQIKDMLLTGLPGIVLQWALIPLLLYRLSHQESAGTDQA